MRALAVAVALLTAACSRPSVEGTGPADAAPEATSTATAVTVAAVTASAAPAEGAPTASASSAESAPTASAAAEVDAGAKIVVDAGTIDAAAAGAIAREEVRGLVAAVVHGGRVVFQKAYGLRSVDPEERIMTADTVFDLASLTKAVVTAPCIHLLAERGSLRLSDPVVKHLPSFGKHGKDRITIEELLLHTSGLVADNSIIDYKPGRTYALGRIDDLPLVSEPGERFAYSDVGYVVLGAIVEKVSGEPLDVFAREHLFAPLGMRDTSFNPSPALRARAAPTEPRDGTMLQGVVHDPRAHFLGGVAGHAGLFSTAPDLARFVTMLLARGRGADTEVLSPTALQRMIAPHELPGGTQRTLGWDVRPGFTGGNGYGHTGFTGTSIWIDPGTDTGLVLLTSRLHPDGKGDVSRLRREVASAVAKVRAEAPKAAASIPPTAPPAKAGAVLTGIDVLEREGFASLKGRKIGLTTNQSGIDHEGRSTIDVLRAAEGVTLVALFSPEHGIRGAADGRVRDSRDARTGLPVYSLYGARMRPTEAQLAGIDTIVFDLQDAGARFYTFPTTLGYLMETAAEHKLRIVVLDRPNPTGGVAVEGPVLEAGRASFTEYHRLPLRHGMTVGELAQLFNAERSIGADLAVVRLQGWRREQTFDRTGLVWVSPSPSLRSVDEALLYPGVALLDGTNVSVGRGTERPFEQVGAPFVDAARLTQALTDLHLPGVRFAETSFTPKSGVHAGEACAGVLIGVVDRAKIEPVRLGLAIAQTLLRLHAKDFEPASMRRMIGHEPTYAAVVRGDPIDGIIAGWQADMEAFAASRKKYLLYTP
ncbi:Hypothetical protein A7982_07317 [Minicystis rosea]|nr:Hypothetical protein A7982_07317 [Minicystis rosea]